MTDPGEPHGDGARRQPSPGSSPIARVPNDLGMRDPYPSYKEGPIDREKELRRALRGVPAGEYSRAARYFRLGWDRLAQLQAPILRRWEESFWRQAREIDLLRGQIGRLISRVSRLEDRG